MQTDKEGVVWEERKKRKYKTKSKKMNDRLKPREIE